MEKIKSQFQNVIVVMSILAGLFFLDSRDETRMNQMQSKMDQQSQRTDRLYEMFISLLKERK